MALPDRIFAHASPHSIGGQSMFVRSDKINCYNVAAFASSNSLVAAATAKLQAAGFEVLQASALTINFAGPPDAFERVFKTEIVEKEIPQRGTEFTRTFLDSSDTEMLGHVSTFGTPMSDVLEGVALEVPRSLFSPSGTPPAVNYWHLNVPHDVAAGCRADGLHALGVTGLGIKVAMVDSGWYRHPFFTQHGYDVAPVVLGPAASLPDNDESGHGTGESANILAVAPGCQLLPVKANFVNTTGAFNEAVALRPDIITCSWGSDTPDILSAADVVLASSLAAAVASGIIVIFSAGNGHAGFPGQHPDVVSVGGVFLHPDGRLEASNYSSGFQSRIFPGRRVPDVCGLVGQRPRAIYIMLPVEPGDNIDTGNAGGPFPQGDETATDDGWAGFSGTSAAAPQLAGVAALMKQVFPSITPEWAKAALSATARDVSEGSCSPVTNIHFGLPAAPGPDDATGQGLVDAYAAVSAAYLLSVTGFPPAAPPDPVSKAVTAYYQGMADAAAALGLT